MDNSTSSFDFIYNEVVSKKDGRHYVFCDFEKLIQEATGYKSIDEALASPSIRSGKELICHCPFCKAEGHTKHKLYIKDDLTVGNCFVCGRTFVNVDNKIDVDVDIPIMMEGPQKLEVVPLADPVWSLDKFNDEFDDYDEDGVKYIQSRHIFMKDIWPLLEFKFWNGNPVMPFKYHDQLIYYQIRFANVKHGDKRPRYFFPPMPQGKKPPYIIEVGDKKKIIICEGIYDAIALLIQAPGYTPFAVLGSSITDYQIQFLREYVPEDIIIYMDETEISIRIANRLKSVIYYCPIRIIKSNGPDPEENLNSRISKNLPLGWIK